MLFRPVDKKLENIGFKKVEDNKHVVIYERQDTKYCYTQVVALVHKRSGRHIIQSYDKNLFDTKKIGNTCVGLSYYETKLFLKKMKEKGWKTTKREEAKKNENNT